ncbi:MAG: putative lipid II flippase FtsW [Candidatus Omnitrophica bacterium]|nr:putative lipid II flippase FtsW [Candidatus Omnitrophota bacterium]
MRKTRVMLFLVVLILVAVGVVMIYSSSCVFAYEKYHDSAYFLKRHIIFLVFGIMAAVFFMSFDYGRLKNISKPFLLFSIFLLCMVFVPGLGKAAGGARRWIGIGPVSFQPSEIAKLALVLYAADILSRKQSEIKDFFHGFLPLVIALGICLALILAGSDLGTAVALALLIVIMAFIAGVDIKQLFTIMAPGIILMAGLIATKPYRVKRIIAFINPWSDPKGAGFQIIQSMIAIGSGGVFGVGLAHSKQKFFYLPEAHTDFIFSIIGEELGIVGSMGIVLLFAFLIWLGFKIAYFARDLFGQFLAFGLVTMIALQVLINIAAVTAIIPTKGMPLPFISYGGTSLVYSLASIGLLLNIARHRR